LNEKQAKRLAIYPGTFDPITNGHLDIIARAADLFDEVVVALATNSQKTPLFSVPERLALIESSLKSELGSRTNIRADMFHGLLVDYARKLGAVAVVRGLRVLSDFEYEFQMALVNRKLAQEISTVFLMPHEDYTYLNSTIVRELAQHGEVIESFVPPVVAEALRKKYSK
jgi:pantetheine-phosphate adenylyltransferase